MKHDSDAGWLSLFGLVLLCGLVVAKLVVSYGCRVDVTQDDNAGVTVTARRCGGK
jgi:hypothetical protein